MQISCLKNGVNELPHWGLLKLLQDPSEMGKRNSYFDVRKIKLVDLRNPPAVLKRRENPKQFLFTGLRPSKLFCLEKRSKLIIQLKPLYRIKFLAVLL